MCVYDLIPQVCSEKLPEPSVSDGPSVDSSYLNRRDKKKIPLLHIHMSTCWWAKLKTSSSVALFHCSLIPFELEPFIKHGYMFPVFHNVLPGISVSRAINPVEGLTLNLS